MALGMDRHNFKMFYVYTRICLSVPFCKNYSHSCKIQVQICVYQVYVSVTHAIASYLGKSIDIYSYQGNKCSDGLAHSILHVDVLVVCVGTQEETPKKTLHNF